MSYRNYQDDLRMIREGTRIFEDASQGYASNRVTKRVMGLITSENFLSATFCPAIPKENRHGEKESIQSALVTMYDLASKPKSIVAINCALSDYGYARLTRTGCVFLASVVNLGIANMNTKATDLGQKLDHDEINDYQHQRVLEKLENYQNELWALMDHIKTALKRDARDISRATNLPKKIVYSALYTVPGPNYLDIYKLSYYLRAMLNNVYGFVDATDTWDFEDVAWTPFFRAIFGKGRIPDVASALLVEENVRDLSPYQKNPDAVAMCMRSLMSWALSTLNRIPDDAREHMIELYLKRINGILKETGVGLHLDLTSIDSVKFANLARTIQRYADKFKAFTK